MKMLVLFLETASASIEKLEEAEKAANVLWWLQVAHQLKGAAQNITAKRLVALCIEGEEIQHLPHPQSANVIYNMYKEMALLREAIGQHLGTTKPVSLPK